MATKYPEINHHGLTEYHRQRLCYPYTNVPAFTFWEPMFHGPMRLGNSRMLEWQDDRCALCGFRERLVEDHDHDTGLVRGMICKSCNVTEGLNDHNLDQWRNGVNVCAELGIVKVYQNVYGQTPIRQKLSDAMLDEIAEAMI